MTAPRTHVIVIRTVDDGPVVFRSAPDLQRDAGQHGVVFTVDRIGWDVRSRWTLRSSSSA